MSEIKVNSIKGTGASTAAITVNSSDGTCIANITNNLTNKNIIINGAMQVAQRGTSDSSTNGNGTVDRFQLIRSGVDENPTQSQISLNSTDTGPYQKGFRNAFRVTNGNQTSVGTSDYITMRYKIEAQDIANSGWNYTDSNSFITFSFWVRSSVAQNFYGYLKTVDGTAQMYSCETGSLSANTWTKITKTIAGNSNLQFDNDNDIGFEIYLSQFWGTDRTGSVSLDTWRTYNGAGRTPDFTSTWYTTDGATFDLTGVQLEVGSVATDFEHRSFAQELALCQRYYYVHAKGDNKVVGVSVGYQTNDIFLMIYPKVEMRTTPTFEQATGTNYYRAYNNGGQDMFDNWGSLWNTHERMIAINANSSGGLGIGGVGGQAQMIITSQSGASLAFSAEL